VARVLVGYDGSDPSRRALAYAIDRAKLAGDEIVLLTVIPDSVRKTSLSGMMPAGLALPPQMGKTFEANAQERLDDVIAEHKASGVAMSALVRSGEIGHAFTEAVRESGASEIVIGHKSFEREALQLGPIAERLVKHMPATVIVVR
jgi:nucleotide-binding universal stress UspA family protein